MTARDPRVAGCGRPVEFAPGEQDEPEQKAAQRQLEHWVGSGVTSYVGLFVTPDGVALASSVDDPNRLLALATLLHRKAERFALECLTSDLGMDEDEDEEDEDE